MHDRLDLDELADEAVSRNGDDMTTTRYPDDDLRKYYYLL
jgi:hypothetical protein